MTQIVTEHERLLRVAKLEDVQIALKRAHDLLLFDVKTRETAVLRSLSQAHATLQEIIDE